MRDFTGSIGTFVLGTVVLTMACSTPVDESGDDAADSGAALPPVMQPGDNPGNGGVGPDNPPPPAEEEEVCDGADNDSDGQVDEVGCVCTGDTACFAGPPESRGVGECQDGIRECVDNEFFGPCVGSVGPTEDTCGDGLDSDCDGQVDECCEEECPDPDDPGGDNPGDPGGDDPGGDNPDDPNGGVEAFVVGQNQESRPVDFIMVVDNSGSMDDTVARVEANLGTFSTRLVQAGIDYHFALISERGTDPREPDVCIPQPMAGPNCTDTDRFVHRDQEIDSEDGFERLLECWHQCDDGAPGIRDFLRPQALLQIIMVTDDESDLSWPNFAGEVRALGYPDFVLHGVVGLQDRDCVADRGDQYIQGANETGGELLNICDHDWGNVLDVILDATVIRLQRTFVLAGDPDPATLRVFVEDANGVELEQVGNWVYDPAANSITFAEDANLPAGTRVVIRYQPR